MLDHKYKILSHGIEINENYKLSLFLYDLIYPDGFVYIVLKSIE